MLPHAADTKPAASRIECSIDVVVVLPLVPVTTSHCRGGPYIPDRSTCHVNSMSPHTGTPAAAAAASTGASGRKPGLVTTSWNSAIRRGSAARSSTGTVDAPASAQRASASAAVSVTVTCAPRSCSGAMTARPEMPAPVTRTRAPRSPSRFAGSIGMDQSPIAARYSL